jgi:hypothetical protein
MGNRRVASGWGRKEARQISQVSNQTVPRHIQEALQARQRGIYIKIVYQKFLPNPTFRCPKVLHKKYIARHIYKIARQKLLLVSKSKGNIGIIFLREILASFLNVRAVQ